MKPMLMRIATILLTTTLFSCLIALTVTAFSVHFALGLLMTMVCCIIGLVIISESTGY